MKTKQTITAWCEPKINGVFRHIVIGFKSDSADPDFDVPLMHNLRVTCQTDDTSLANEHHNLTYSWDVFYRDIYRVDLCECDRMLKTLKLIDRSMKKDQDAHGHPLSFGQYCGRVFAALKVKTINRGGKWGQVDMSPSDAVYHIDSTAQDWRDELKAKAEAPTLAIA